MQWKYAFPVPDTFPPEYLGPLMCGGITAYKPIVQYAKPGDVVGIVGLGGIGCMAGANSIETELGGRGEAEERQRREPARVGRHPLLVHRVEAFGGHKAPAARAAQHARRRSVSTPDALTQSPTQKRGCTGGTEEASTAAANA